MPLFLRTEHWQVPFEIRALILDLGGVLVDEGDMLEATSKITALPEAATWLKSAYLHFGHAIAICTAQSEESARYSLREALRAPWIRENRFKTGAAKGVGPEAVRSALALLDISPEPSEVLFIDDNPAAIANALVAGYQTVWVSKDSDEKLLQAFEAVHLRFPPRIADQPERFVTIVPHIQAVEFSN